MEIRMRDTLRRRYCEYGSIAVTITLFRKVTMISELAYDRKGAGEPVVLLHGIGHRRQAWNPIFDALARDYDVIAFDLAGFGQ